MQTSWTKTLIRSNPSVSHSFCQLVVSLSALFFFFYRRTMYAVPKHVFSWDKTRNVNLTIIHNLCKEETDRSLGWNLWAEIEMALVSIRQYPANPISFEGIFRNECMLSLINVQGRSLYMLSSLYEEDTWPGEGQEKLEVVTTTLFSVWIWEQYQTIKISKIVRWKRLVILRNVYPFKCLMF